jgi:hypothetical protein
MGIVKKNVDPTPSRLSAPDAAAVELHDASRYREAKSGAEPRRSGSLPESLEDSFQILRRNARSGVTHGHLYLVLGVFLRAKFDTPSGGRELQRVPQEVGENLDDTAMIDHHVRDVVRHVALECYGFLARRFRDRFAGFVNHRTQLIR